MWFHDFETAAKMMWFQSVYADPIAVFISCRSHSQVFIIHEWDLRETHHHFVLVSMMKNMVQFSWTDEKVELLFK